MNLKKNIVTIILVALAMEMIIPLIWMFSTSFKSPAEVFEFPIKWIPDRIIMDHHVKVWTGVNSFVPYYLNSIKISVISTIGATFLSAFAAYGFARVDFKGRDPLFLLYLSMM